MAEPKSMTPPSPSAPRPGGGLGAFDIWLRDHLHRVHDAVAAEPVPVALRRLATREPSPAEVMRGDGARSETHAGLPRR